jgi:hypothetical protein
MKNLLKTLTIFLTVFMAAFGSSANAQTTQPVQSVVATAGMYLQTDKAYFSPNGLYWLVFQSSDGNLVVRRVGPTTDKVIWATNKPGDKALMQNDGNFVVSKNGVATWTSRTEGSATRGGTALINNSGQFVVEGATTFRTPADPEAPPPPCTALRQFPICTFRGQPYQFDGWVLACNIADAQQQAAAIGASYGVCPR